MNTVEFFTTPALVSSYSINVLDDSRWIGTLTPFDLGGGIFPIKPLLEKLHPTGVIWIMRAATYQGESVQGYAAGKILVSFLSDLAVALVRQINKPTLESALTMLKRGVFEPMHYGTFADIQSVFMPNVTDDQFTREALYISQRVFGLAGFFDPRYHEIYSQASNFHISDEVSSLSKMVSAPFFIGRPIQESDQLSILRQYFQ